MKKNDLTSDMIERLYKIVISKVYSDYEKAVFMQYICSYENFINNYENYKDKNDVIKIKAILDMYQYINNYNILKRIQTKTLSNVKYTMELDLIMNILNSNISELSKAIYIYKLYTYSSQFSKEYIQINDDEWLYANKEKIKLIYSTMKKWENSGIKKEADYYIKYESKYDVSSYSRFIVKKYIETPNDLIKAFYYFNNIDRQIFEYAVNVVNQTDVDLYRAYEEKEKDIFNYNLEKIDYVYNCIEMHQKPDGSEFTLYDFINNIPFQESTLFRKKLLKFLNKYRPNMVIKYNNYLLKNNIKDTSFNIYINQFSENDVLYVNDKVIKRRDIENIKNYIINKGYVPTYLLMRLTQDKYLNGELDPNLFNVNNNVATIIPSEKSRQEK